MSTRSRGKAYSGDSRGWKFPRDRKINARIVPCPTCNAVEGVWCINLVTGEEKHKSHDSRRRMAIRKMREEGKL